MTFHDMEDGDEPDALCCDCGDGVYAEELSVEAWERFNAVLCEVCFTDRCADEADEDEVDPDRLREDRDERRALDKESDDHA